MQKTLQITKWVKKTIVLSVVVAASSSYGGWLDSEIKCDDFLGGASGFNLDDLLKFNIKIGSCDLSFNGSGGSKGIGKCQEALGSFNSEISKIIGKGNYNADCGATSTSDINSRLKKAYEKGVSPTDRLSRTMNPGTGKVYFAGGSTSLETQKVILKESGAVGTSSDYIERHKLAISSCKDKPACSAKKGCPAAITEDIKQGLSKNTSKQKEFTEFQKQRVSASGNTADLATLPKKYIMYPSEDVKATYPKEDRAAYQSAGQRSMAIESAFRASLEAIKKNRDAIGKICNNKDAITSCSTYTSKTKSAIDDRKCKKGEELP